MSKTVLSFEKGNEIKKNEEWFSDVKLILVDPHSRDPEDKKLLNQTYLMWEAAWSPVWSQYENKTRISSDNFTKQDMLMVLTKGGRPIILGGFKTVDLNDVWVRNDAYFYDWSEEAFAKLRAFNPQCLIGNQITVSPDLHGTRFGFSLRDLCLGLIIKVFLGSGFPHMSGTMRKDRKVHESAYRFNATALHVDWQVRNVPVDLVHFIPERMDMGHNPDLEKVLNVLWEKRIAKVLIEVEQTNYRRAA